MKTFTFENEKSCPECWGTVTTVELKPDYDPVAVFGCPHCSVLLWKPGLDPNDETPLVVFVAGSDEDSI